MRGVGGPARAALEAVARECSARERGRGRRCAPCGIAAVSPRNLAAAPTAAARAAGLGRRLAALAPHGKDDQE
eukprot:4318903-Pyramimonas_sp.AAC.1